MRPNYHKTGVTPSVVSRCFVKATHRWRRNRWWRLSSPGCWRRYGWRHSASSARTRCPSPGQEWALCVVWGRQQWVNINNNNNNNKITRVVALHVKVPPPPFSPPLCAYWYCKSQCHYQYMSTMLYLVLSLVIVYNTPTLVARDKW